MNIIKYVNILFFIVCFFSCSVKQAESFLMNSNYTIDLDEKQELSIPLSNYFKNAKIVIPETGKDCLIGIIDDLQVSNGYIYILDKRFANSLFVFDMDGHYIRKIGNVGRGPGEYIKLHDFTLDTENRFIFLLDYGQRVHKYTLDGDYVQTITPKVQNTNIHFFQYYSGRLYLSVLGWKTTPDDYMLLEADPDDGMILSSSLSLKYNKRWGKMFSTGHSFFMSRLNSPPMYTQLFMDYIVTIGEKITPYIELKSKNLVKNKDLEHLLNEENFVENFMNTFRESSKIWDVHDFIENDDFMMFRYRTNFRDFNSVIYHKETGSVKLVKYLYNDLIFKNDKNGLFRRFVFSDTKGAYEILQDVNLQDFLESIRKDEVVHDLDKVEDLLKLSNTKEESNPIIIFYEFK